MLCSVVFGARSQTPNQIIESANARFRKVNDYKANVQVICNIPAISIDPIGARVYYQKPDQFKVKSTGILILPKQNSNFLFTALSDTGSYTAIKTGEELLNGVNTHIINIIPNSDTSDLILGKFWIDANRGLVMKAQLTTKSQGTILIQNTFGGMSPYGLPDKMEFTVDTKKFKLPKVLSLDINTSSQQDQPDSAMEGKGKITLLFTNYEVNKGIDPSVFK